MMLTSDGSRLFDKTIATPARRCSGIHASRLSDRVGVAFSGGLMTWGWGHRTDGERFWEKVNKNGPVISGELGPCWIWFGARNNLGYGCFSWDGRQGQAHRYGYEIEAGKIPAGLHLDHLCRVHACVRRSHLEAVTPKVNCLRGQSPPAIHARRTRCPKGHAYDAVYRNGHGKPLARCCKLCVLTNSMRRYWRDRGQPDRIRDYSQPKQPLPPRPCAICFGLTTRVCHGRCHACDIYFRRTGRERTLSACWGMRRTLSHTFDALVTKMLQT